VLIHLVLIPVVLIHLVLNPVLLNPVLLNPVLLNPVLLISVLMIRGQQRLDANRSDDGSTLLLSYWGLHADLCWGGLRLGCRGPGMGRWGSCMGICSGPRLGISSVQRELLRGGPPLPAGRTFPLLDSGDQIVLAHPGNVRNAHLAGQLTQVGHHHCGQPATAT
jgi:hypothetical protein